MARKLTNPRKMLALTPGGYFVTFGGSADFGNLATTV